LLFTQLLVMCEVEDLTAIIDASGLKECEAVPLVTICVELVERGHACRLVVTEAEEARALTLARGVLRLNVLEEIKKSIVVAPESLTTTTTEVSPIITSLVASTEGGSLVGVVDLVSGRASALAFEAAKVPYFAAFSGGLASTLAVIGILPPTVAPQTCASVWLRKQSIMLYEDVTAQRLLQESTEATRREEALKTYRSASGCFVATFEDAEAPTFYEYFVPGLKRSTPSFGAAAGPGAGGGPVDSSSSSLQFCRHFGPKKVVPASHPLLKLHDEVILVQVGTDEDTGLTPAGTRALFDGLKSAKDATATRASVGVLWRVSNPALFKEAIHPGEEELLVAKTNHRDNWLATTDQTLSLPSLLAHPKVKCLVTDCAWTDCADALRFGVPILAVPIDHEQKLNAQKLEQLGAAVVLEGALDAVTDALFLNPPTAPDIRSPEKFGRRVVAKALLRLLAPIGKLRGTAKKIQKKHFSSDKKRRCPSGAAFIADTIEAHFNVEVFPNDDDDDDDDLYDTFYQHQKGAGGVAAAAVAPKTRYVDVGDDDDDDDDLDDDDDDILLQVLSAKHPKCECTCTAPLFTSSTTTAATPATSFLQPPGSPPETDIVLPYATANEQLRR